MSAADLKERLRADLKAAMRERKAADVGLLRSLIAAIDNAEAVSTEPFEERLRLREPVGEVTRRELDAAALEAILASEAQSRTAAADDYERNGRPEDAARLRSEANRIARYRG